jgi:hypothetical protein
MSNKNRIYEFKKVIVVTYYKDKIGTEFENFKCTRLIEWMIINLNKLDKAYIKFKTIPQRWKLYKSKNKFTPFKTYIEETKSRDKFPYYNQKKIETL